MLQLLRYLHSCSGCFRLEQLPGGAFTHWKSAAFSRRTREAVIANGEHGMIYMAEGGGQGDY
jgi:hypothetical protein